MINLGHNQLGGNAPSCGHKSVEGAAGRMKPARRSPHDHTSLGRRPLSRLSESPHRGLARPVHRARNRPSTDSDRAGRAQRKRSCRAHGAQPRAQLAVRRHPHATGTPLGTPAPRRDVGLRPLPRPYTLPCGCMSLPRRCSGDGLRESASRPQHHLSRPTAENTPCLPAVRRASLDLPHNRHPPSTSPPSRTSYITVRRSRLAPHRRSSCWTSPTTASAARYPRSWASSRNCRCSTCRATRSAARFLTSSAT